MTTILLMSAYVAGVPHRNPDLSQLRSTSPLRLVAEPQNQYDPQAIAIYDGNQMFGYVPREQTIVIHQAIAQGLSLSAFVAEIGTTKWKEVLFHVFAKLE